MARSGTYGMIKLFFYFPNTLQCLNRTCLEAQVFTGKVNRFGELCCSPESAHKICCSFIQEIKDYTVNTRGSSLFFLFFFYTFSAPYTHSSDGSKTILITGLKKEVQSNALESTGPYEKVS